MVIRNLTCSTSVGVFPSREAEYGGRSQPVNAFPSCISCLVGHIPCSSFSDPCGCMKSSRTLPFTRKIVHSFCTGTIKVLRHLTNPSCPGPGPDRDTLYALSPHARGLFGPLGTAPGAHLSPSTLDNRSWYGWGVHSSHCQAQSIGEGDWSRS